ncbi:cytochrome P450 [Pseudomonas sp. PDM24]|uniref:cytochrome P450 n=1 Tax=Pseudomonas sp. PDM24 TaxID=2854777 RepID=UPI001C47DC1A|nr:cytochrome P450 [Pseudomonas sp. PDM24]MBV7495081.1 cytochrome P450 [Pseudomonas sp. PDM24]
MDKHNTGCPITMTDPKVMTCPFHAYDTLREEKDIYIDPVTGFYVITRYDDLKTIADDPQTFANNTGQLGSRSQSASQKVGELYSREGYLHVDTLVTNDPPSHTRYRSLVDKAFNALRIRSAEGTILAVTNALIDKFPDGPFDLAEAFSIPLPVRMIAEQLGIPPELGPDFKRWSDALLQQASPNLSEDEMLAVAKVVVQMQQFFAKMIRDTREKPSGTLLSDLANLDIDGQRLSEGELVSILMQLLVAGNETTTNTLSAAVLRLAEDPALQDHLRKNPDQIRNFYEEVLRLDAALQGLFRRATKDAQVGTTAIPAGAILHLRFGAANRDPQRYDNRNEVDLQRKAITQHLTFGHGIHFCLGNQLARAELRIGLSRLLETTTSLRLADVPDNVVRPPHFIAYGISKLMIEITRA